MRILILNQSFYPDVVSVAQHAADLASALASEGHSVTVVASQRAYNDPAVSFPPHETWRGCEVRRIRSLGLGKRTKWGRILDSASLLAAFLYELIRLPAFDVVLAMTHPPLVSVLAAAVTRLKGGALVQWVMDLNPDEAIAAGWVPKNSATARILNRALGFALASSSRIIVLDRFMSDRIQAKGVSGDRLTVIPPWSHNNLLRYDGPAREAFRVAHGLANKFVVMYSGNLSPVHPLDTLLQAAVQLQDQADIVFCFVGGGNAMPAVRDFAESNRLHNIVCLPYQPAAALGASLSAADLHVVAMGDAMVGIVHPCKIYNILALGIPILHLGPSRNHIGDILRAVSGNGSAYSVVHGDAGAAVNAIRRAAALRLQTVDELSAAAAPFSQESLLPKMLRTLERAAPLATNSRLAHASAPNER